MSCLSDALYAIGSGAATARLPAFLSRSRDDRRNSLELASLALTSYLSLAMSCCGKGMQSAVSRSFLIAWLVCAGILSKDASAQLQRRVVAGATVARATPFAPPPRAEERLPLACGGYCVVTLHRDQKWIAGDQSLEASYDGKAYRMAGRRQLAMFVAAPQLYVPALGGDCPVTFVDQGIRQRGALKYGTIVAGRLYFFAAADQRRKFEESPKKYEDADLAIDGACPVTFVDAKQRVAGVESTVLIRDGFRYYFAGLQQRKQFLANPERYQHALGLAAPAKAAPGRLPRGKRSAAPLAPLEIEDSPGNDRSYALNRYCVVTLLSEGRWQRGRTEHSASGAGQTYLFASAEARKKFLSDPEKFLPANLGYCVVSQQDSGEQVLGSIDHAAEYQGRLYLFAAAEAKQRFLATPAEYTNGASKSKREFGQ